MSDSDLFTSIDDEYIEDIVNKNLEIYISEELHPGDERRIFANAMILLMCCMYHELKQN